MSCTPVTSKSYPAHVSPRSGRVRFPLTPSVKDKQNVIYQIHNKETAEAYIGKTAQLFQKRLKQHESHVHSKGDRGKTRLYQAIRENPTNFSVRLLAEATPATLADAEAEWIKETDAVQSGYNENGGRGGGPAAEPADMPYVPPEKSTPEKYFPLRKRDDGTITADLTPRSARIKRVVYVLRNTETEERYVGRTKRELQKRFNEHLHFANHPEKETCQMRLYQDIHQNPGQFNIGILEAVSTTDSLDKAENHHIKAKRARTTGYNKTYGTKSMLSQVR